MKRAYSNALAAAAVLLVGLALFSGAWFADDALRLWRISLNWIRFGSPDFNPGQTLLGFGQPLWAALLTAGFALGGRLVATAIALQFLFFCEGALLLLACHRISLGPCPTRAQALRGVAKVVLVGALLAASNCFREFMAAGLEFALCFLLVALIAYLLARREAGLGTDSGRSTAAIALAGSLLLLTRYDMAWALAPAELVLGWRSRSSLPRRFPWVILGCSPLVLWLVYASVHFGSVFPHRPESELLLALPRAAILAHGELYILGGLIQEPLSFVLPVIALASGAYGLWRARKASLSFLLALGVLAFLCHAVWHGGDSISGRLLCPAVCVSAAALACRPAFPVRTYAFVACYVLVFFDLGKVSIGRARASRDARTLELFKEWGIVDDFARQHARNPEARVQFARLAARDWREGDGARSGNASPLLTATPGWDGLQTGPGKVVYDWRAMGPARPELHGTAALSLRFKPAAVGMVEPVLSVGEPSGCTQVMAERLPRSGLRFQIRRSALVTFSRAFPNLDTGVPHRLVVRFGSDAAGSEQAENFVVMLDGVLLKDFPMETRRYNFDEVVAGWNTQGYSGCSTTFMGDIAPLEPARKGELERGSWPLTVADRGLIDLRLKFSRVTNSAEPIVVTGTERHADIVFVRRVDSGRVLFGQEHWGQMPELGPVVDIDDAREHTLKVALGPLFAHSDAIMRPDCVRVTMDGRIVLETRQELYPFKPNEVSVLDNQFAGSFCGRDFLGETAQASVESLDGLVGSVAKMLEENTGPVSMTLRFDGSIVGWGLGLIETGVTGAGDIVYVVREDRTHIRFYFDHWGVGGIVGTLVEIDPARAYAFTIAMGSLAGPDDVQPKSSVTVRATLDGRVVLDGQSPCHPSKKGQIHLLENALGSGSVSVGFDGTCLAVGRGRGTVSLSY